MCVQNHKPRFPNHGDWCEYDSVLKVNIIYMAEDARIVLYTSTT